MFGSGIGELNVYIRTIGGSSPDRKIWGLTGDAGNNWYMAQAPVASSKPFKVCKDTNRKIRKCSIHRLYVKFINSIDIYKS